MILNNIGFYKIIVQPFKYGIFSPAKDRIINHALYSAEANITSSPKPIILSGNDLRIISIVSKIVDFHEADSKADYAIKASLGKGSYATIGVKNRDVILDESMNCFISVNWTDLGSQPRVNGFSQHISLLETFLYRTANAEESHFIMHAFKNNTTL